MSSILYCLLNILICFLTFRSNLTNDTVTHNCKVLDTEKNLITINEFVNTTKTNARINETKTNKNCKQILNTSQDTTFLSIIAVLLASNIGVIIIFMITRNKLKYANIILSALEKKLLIASSGMEFNEYTR